VWAAFSATTPEATEAILDSMVEHMDQIEKINKKYEPVEYIGMMPTCLNDGFFVTHPGGLIEYFYYLRSKKWDVFFVSLEDNTFNRCKSNIAHLEAFSAGAITVAPHWEEWNVAGVLNYDPKSETGLLDAVTQAMEMGFDYKRFLWEKSYKNIQKNHLLSVTNQHRRTLLTDLL
jgi:hypothetical protein